MSILSCLKNIIVVLLILSSSFWWGCSPKIKNNGDSSGPVVVLEESISPINQPVSNPVVISGFAQYEYYRPVNILGLTEASVGVPFVNPIRSAEVRVKNSAGAVVQAGFTDNTGHYSLNIEKPSSTSQYTIEVNSRSYSDSMIASILDKPSTKLFYSLKGFVSVAPSDTSVSVSDMTALATGTLEGGAFHILDKILEVNDYLRTNTTDSHCSSCTLFTVAPKVSVYWSKGFNPASYFGETSGLSFFDAEGSLDNGLAGLYILGGDSGDVDQSDTDHFDDSVIIHEYGHFLQSVYWNTDSPGGYHNGNLIIDPRLAFSEGFSNFLPSAVQGSSVYLDTMGSPQGSTSVIVKLDLENEPYGSTSGPDKIITKSPVGEGTYREVSVARALYDFIDSNVDTTFDSNGNNTPSGGASDSSNLPFAFIWQALTSTSFGLNKATQHFVSMGHFNKSLYSAIDASTFTDINAEKTKLDSARLGEFQSNDESEYAILVTKSDTSCSSSRTMTPASDRPVGDGSFYHDLFASSDFYRINHSGGVLNVKLTYSTSGTPVPDLDLYIYKESHNLSEADDIVAHSDAPSSSSSGVEEISADLPAGTYLILVNVVTDGINFTGASSVSYILSSGGKDLCNSP